MAANGIDRLAKEIVPDEINEAAVRTSPDEEESYDN